MTDIDRPTRRSVRLAWAIAAPALVGVALSIWYATVAYSTSAAFGQPILVAGLLCVGISMVAGAIAVFKTHEAFILYAPTLSLIIVALLPMIVGSTT